jgi:hypothetical protein
MATRKKAKKAAKKPVKKAAKKAAPAKKKALAAARKPARASRPKAPKPKAAKKATRKAAKKPALRAKPIRRRDRPGHLDPQYAADLREKSEHPTDPSGFVQRPRSRDDLVEELGEGFVSEATSAEHEGEDMLDQEVPEERGGPFVETTGDQEFAHGTDPSNPKGASREPFPRT